jgi:hypothetical protein
MIAAKQRGGQCKPSPKIMTGELALARHVPCAATRTGNQDQIHHMVQRW